MDFIGYLRKRIEKNRNLMQGTVIFVIALLIILVLILTVKISYDHCKVHHLTIATASEWDEYSKFGKALAKVVEKHNPKIRIQVVNTEGSCENIELLESKKVDFAIAQNDVLTDPAFSKKSIRAVASLFPEVFHLFVAEGAQINTISDLKGKRIALTPTRGGSYSETSLILHTQ